MPGCETRCKPITVGEPKRSAALSFPRLELSGRLPDPRPSNAKAATGGAVSVPAHSENLALAHNDWREQ